MHTRQHHNIGNSIEILSHNILLFKEKEFDLQATSWARQLQCDLQMPNYKNTRFSLLHKNLLLTKPFGQFCNVQKIPLIW